ncbi:ribosome maturation factor RimM [Leptolyngbya sp. FACHB-711]|uniref:ribosome maturation factor RimM n=1 Tax=unclassified Leptolyngbya TaxID=2650499 RepID=UPI00168A0621|nr:ribosome maturation factor RimM [Leptolyngbya sp. FACHB-711]MBD1851642.1 ribosome maturation factor RimM [Cyanobacteria bacterium FACHB-502]MBD2023563.1 ribosome maturation factor RimM [Leptolyngbya sp. FACHB-711]
MAIADEWLEIGKIVAAQGLKGEVRVYPNSDFPERFEEPGKRWMLRPGKTEPEVIELISGRYLAGKGLYVLQLKGIVERAQAEQLYDCRLLIPSTDRPHLEEDEFHVPDLLDLEVIDQATQQAIGRIKDVIPAGNDLLEVELYQAGAHQAGADGTIEQLAQTKESAKTVLIPFVKEIVPIVDLVQRRVEIVPPPGLLDLK